MPVLCQCAVGGFVECDRKPHVGVLEHLENVCSSAEFILQSNTQWDYRALQYTHTQQCGQNYYSCKLVPLGFS